MICSLECAVHWWQVLHLDIAPNNIVLHEGRGMLVDFGIARQGGISSVDQGIGRVAFKSIDRLDVGKASLSGERSLWK